MCHKYKLIGFINLFDIIPDFIYPVFKYKGEYYFQSGDNDIIRRFVIVKDELLKKLLSVEKLKRIVVSRNSKQIYAYQSEEGTIVYGNTAYMTEYLTKHSVFSCEYASDSILREEIESFLNEAEEEIKQSQKNGCLEKAIGDVAHKRINMSGRIETSDKENDALWKVLSVTSVLLGIAIFHMINSIGIPISPIITSHDPTPPISYTYIATPRPITPSPISVDISDLTYISFSSIRVSGQNQRAFIYNAPSDLPWESRTMDEDCTYTRLGTEIQVAGFDGDWLLIKYKMPDGTTQMGYTTDIKVPYMELSFDDYTGTIIADCTIDKGNAYTLLKEGTQVKVLGRMDTGIYIETQNETKIIRGIIPEEYIKIYNVLSDESSVSAPLLMPLSTRSGPSIRHDKTGTYFPINWENQTVQVLGKFWENEIWWVLVDFKYNDQARYRVWTGSKRIKVDITKLDEVKPMYSAVALATHDTYWGPGTDYAKAGIDVPDKTDVVVYGRENGFTEIEFDQDGEKHRLWVPAYVVH